MAYLELEELIMHIAFLYFFLIKSKIRIIISGAFCINSYQALCIGNELHSRNDSMKTFPIQVLIKKN